MLCKIYLTRTKTICPKLAFCSWSILLGASNSRGTKAFMKSAAASSDWLSADKLEAQDWTEPDDPEQR